MRTIAILWTALTLAAGSSTVVAQKAATLTIVIKGVKDASGQVSVALFNNEKDFMKNRLDAKTTSAKEGEVQVIFENVAPGEYAVTIMHDENQNNKLDANMMGIPKEGYAFSNDAVGMFGPPSFERAKFSCNASKEIVVTMRY